MMEVMYAYDPWSFFDAFFYAPCRLRLDPPRRNRQASGINGVQSRGYSVPARRLAGPCSSRLIITKQRRIAKQQFAISAGSWGPPALRARF